MNWTAYEVILRLETPLHIGWRRVGNLWQTRPYILPHQLLAALAARCAEWDVGGNEDGSPNPYVQKLEWLRKRMRFSYFFPTLERDPQGCYLPYYDERGNLKWKCGKCEPPELSELSAEEFDYLFLDAVMRTAIDHDRSAVQEGQLFAFEYVRPRCREWPGGAEGKEVYFGGYVFLSEELSKELKKQVSAEESLARLLDRLQVGGERKYGWGLIRVSEKDLRGLPGEKIELYGRREITVQLESELYVTVEKDVGIPAHVLLQGVKDKIAGQVEVVLMRSTRSEGDKTFYGKEVLGKPCYRPGSRCKDGSTKFLIDAGEGNSGIWGIWKISG
ncbi:RAMP superfamily CRISPR-associated protein [Ammonifex thiophilus]|uniref:CRISPR type III-associated protein domain-containing protein n=1 Tax=Ammonifex thiophilus TaxID=444093 RepID=A0A3D8P1A8_9THEO|nr:RAMP superfamily CRISPR-associated protein [Ammonifex thiophilus]RDV81259.1 hypothetical protein DXX99_09465 [Ammonifex thiophilus]